jgi:hypothetical protein
MSIHYSNLSFLIDIVRDNENWLLVLKKSALVTWVKRENYSWPEGRKKLDHPALDYNYFVSENTVKETISPSANCQQLKLLFYFVTTEIVR